MNNATKSDIGNNSTSRRKKTKATAPTAKGLHRMDESAKGQFGGSQGQAKIRSNLATSDAFLKVCFKPRLNVNESLVKQSKRKAAKTERDFYKSLSQLAEHYGIEPMPIQDFNYPYNISLSLWDIEKQLRNKTENCDDIRLIQKGDKTYFVLRERCNTGASLFYIPVVPLYLMLKDKTRRKTACLLLSVCTYLYRIADVPYYRMEGSYLDWHYEILGEWIAMDEEIDESHTYKKELQRAEIVGDKMGQKIANINNLLFFEQRLKAFRPKNNFDKECFELADRTFKLYCEYPNESLYRNAHYNNAFKSEEDDDDYYYEQTAITMDKYISFFAESNGLIYETLIESVNNDFNEYADTQEPTIYKTFDGSSITNKNLDFENRFFKILNRLCTLLN
ncbi:hypothetical protein [Chryseobacterium sp. VD8]|uniref:hypothetical protein n=1 Tax=Chryseobacterium sp. VD8 TaxID=3081254 RepID=UPI0030158966